MREIIPAPCEHFDIDSNKHRDTCPDVTARCEDEACRYYMDEVTAMDADSDPHAPCKRRRTAFTDTETVDMFKEACSHGCGLNVGGICTSEYHINCRHHCLKKGGYHERSKK